MSIKPLKNVMFAAGVVLVVAVHADLPAGYTQVPFIKPDGNCQVRTGVTPASTDKEGMHV